MKPKRRKRGAFSVPVTRRGEIVRHAKHVGAADTEDYWRWLVAWVWHNPTSKDQVGALMFASVRMGRGLGTSEIDEILDQAKTIRRRCSADAVAKFLGVTYKQRQQLGITTIGSIDVGRPARTLLRKPRDRRCKEHKRRERGIRPLAQALSRTKPWEAEGMSRRTWYRRRGTTASTAISPLKSGGGTGTTASTALFLSGEDLLVPPERKKAGLPRGSLSEKRGGNSSTHSALREESVSVDDPGCGWLRSRFMGVRWPRPGHEAACGRPQCTVCEPAHHKQEAAE